MQCLLLCISSDSFLYSLEERIKRTSNRDFQRSVGRSGEFRGSVREFRRRHQEVTQSVENADQFMMISNVAAPIAYIHRSYRSSRHY